MSYRKEEWSPAQLFFLRSRTKKVRVKRYPSCSSDTPLRTPPLYCHLLPYLLPSTASTFLISCHSLLTVPELNQRPITHPPSPLPQNHSPVRNLLKLLNLYALYNSTTQINVYWYVRGKHFDFWQATTEQGKPGYFTTVRRRRFPSREGKREGKRRALLDGKPLL